MGGGRLVHQLKAKLLPQARVIGHLNSPTQDFQGTVHWRLGHNVAWPLLQANFKGVFGLGNNAGQNLLLSQRKGSGTITERQTGNLAHLSKPGPKSLPSSQ